MKRIAMFIHHEVGGAVVAFYGFMKIFKQHNYKIDLYSINHAGESFLPLSQMADQTFDYDLRFRERISGHLPFLREYINTYRYWRNILDLDIVNKEIALQIDKQSYDLVFVHVDKMVKNPPLLKYLNTPTYFYMGEPERFFYDPLSLFEDELDAEDYKLKWYGCLHSIWYAPARYIRNWLWKIESDKNIKKNKKINVLTNSYFTAESIYRAYDLVSKVCYLGIDTSIFKTSKITRKNFVMTVGSLTPNKGHAFLIHALAMVPGNLRPKFVAVTDTAKPHRKNNLISLGKKMNVKVEIREKVAQADLVSLYATSQAFIYGSRLEPFGIVPLEAMAMGLPVVAVKSGGVRETVIDNVTGLLADYDAQDFAEKLTRLLQDKKLWQFISKSGPAYVRKKWSWEFTFQRFEKLTEQNTNAFKKNNSP